MSALRLLLLTLTGPLFALHADAQECFTDEVIIVNLSRDATDITVGNTCVKPFGLADELTEECVADAIEAALPTGCDKRFDIFVPGTNAEHGAWKQFNHLFRSNTNRAKLSLQYEDDRAIESFIGKLDPAKYDR
ncbi:MAG: hypothetical protein V2I57_09935, partial [Xanthomonadales bacterium]|nr:hypothetical protein [Xanthomonadales bacterium]